MTSLMKIDDTDLRILQLLQEDGRRPYTDIAKQLGISEGKVRFRINKMIENQVFEFIIHTNPNKIGLNVQAIIGIITELGYREEVAKVLTQYKEVRFVGAFSGVYDIIIQAYFSNNEQLVDFTDKHLSQIEGVKKIDIFLELKDYKDSFSFID